MHENLHSLNKSRFDCGKLLSGEAFEAKTPRTPQPINEDFSASPASESILRIEEHTPPQRIVEHWIGIAVAKYGGEYRLIGNRRILVEQIVDSTRNVKFFAMAQLAARSM